MMDDDRRMQPLPETTESGKGFRAFWRRLLAGGLKPRQVAWASAAGAALGVAPIPGLQMAACCLVAWRLGLNLPIMLLVSNLSFGPLMAVWAAIAVGLGRWIRFGVEPFDTYAVVVADFAQADGWHAWGTALGSCVTDWLIGSAVLMVVLGAICGAIGFGVAAACQRRGDPDESPIEADTV